MEAVIPRGEPRPGAALDLSGVSKQFGSLTAVRDVDLAIQPGEFITLLGPSGSGKTTTLNMIAGFLEPTSGKILMDGQVLSGTPTHKRNIGVVFQHYALFPHLSVSNNVAFPLRRRGVPKAEQATRVREALEMVRLADKADDRPRTLSGGQQQRVALARALVFRPRLLLMDEPLGALDRKLRDWLQLEIKRIHRELGITFLYVTHDQEEALVLSDRIAIFNEGMIEQCGTGDELYESPESLFVAEFVGESTVFLGSVHQNGAGWVMKHRDMALRAATAPGVNSGDTCALVVRPEHVTIVRPGASPGPGDNVLRGRVRQVVYLGAARKIELALSDGTSLQLREHAQAGPVAEGEEVDVFWSPSSCWLLPNQELDLRAELASM